MKLDWGTVPSWLSAAGTIGATTTALWLARKGDRPRVALSAHAWGSGDRSAINAFLFNQGHEPITVLWVHAGAGWPSHQFYAPAEYDRRPLSHGEGISVEIDLTSVVDAVLRYSRWGQWKRGLSRFSVAAELSNGQKVVNIIARRQTASLLTSGRSRMSQK